MCGMFNALRNCKHINPVYIMSTVETLASSHWVAIPYCDKIAPCGANVNSKFPCDIRHQLHVKHVWNKDNRKYLRVYALYPPKADFVLIVPHLTCIYQVPQNKSPTLLCEYLCRVGFYGDIFFVLVCRNAFTSALLLAQMAQKG